MKQIRFWFDVVSPYAYLAFERLPQALEGLSYSIEYRPVLLGALLQHWGQLGPAEIAPKRDWTYRQVHWLADQYGVALQMPAQHPLNPLVLQRLALACAAPGGGPNRRVVEALLRHVWVGGADANDPQRLAELAASLAPRRDPASPDVKYELRLSTEAAIERGVFGVPAFELEGRLFWGVDALPMLAAALRGDAWFDDAWDAAAAPRPGVRRQV
jgi:2-hydroxychromene-2-carboxylate isomerase